MRISARLRRISVVAVASALALVGAAVIDQPAQAATPTIAGAYVPVASRTVLSTHSVRAKHAITVQVGGHAGIPKSGAAAVELRLNVAAPASSGVLTAYSGKRPNVTTMRFTRGQSATELALVQLPKTGNIKIYNSAGSTVRVSATVNGFYRTGSTRAAGSFVPVRPARVLNAVSKAGAQRSVAVAGHARVPKGAGAVVGVLSAVAPAKGGAAVLWQKGAARPATANLRFSAHTSTATLAVVPLSGSGAIGLRNVSKAKVHYTFDVVGYYVAGAPATAGAAGPLSAYPVVGETFAAWANKTVTVTGRGGVPAKDARAVTAVLTVSDARADGSVLAYSATASSKGATVLQVRKGVTTSGLIAVPLSAKGQIKIVNKAGRAKISLALVGYTLSSSLPTPKVYVSHYIRDLTTNAATNEAKMAALAQSDTRRGSKLVVLHLGAQTVTAPLKTADPGVLLTNTNTRLDYAALVDALTAYVNGYRVSGGIVAIATNTGGDWTAYRDTDRGSDWAAKLITPLRTARSGLTIAGALDAEPADGSGFFATSGQAINWENSFVASGPAPLIFTGAASGCPWTFGGRGACNAGWTQASAARLAGATNPTRVWALPQIYNSAQAVQWANIDAVSGRRIHFLGALTERTASPAQSWTAQQAYPAFWNALAAVGVTTLPAVATDLDIQG